MRLLAVRVEFLKARARCHRFAEEIKLIKEEQRRILVSLHRASLDWDARALASHEQNIIIREGLTCYAAEQAEIRRAMAQSYLHIWGLPITEAVLYTMDDDQEEDDLVIVPEFADDVDENGGTDVEDVGASDSEGDVLHFGDEEDDE